MTEAKSEEKVYKVLGKFSRPVVLILVGLWIFTWVPDITSTPIASLTLEDIALAAVGIVALYFLWAKWLFSPNPDNYEAWGALASLVLLVIGGYIAWLLLATSNEPQDFPSVGETISSDEFNKLPFNPEEFGLKKVAPQ